MSRKYRYESEPAEEKTIEVIRPKDVKKKEPFHYCKWAAGAWEAEFYANTPMHEKSRERTINVMLNDPCWYSTLKCLKTDTRKMQRKIEGGRKPARKKQEDRE